MNFAARVAARYAMEHPSEEAREEYLKKHPKADPRRHTVNETDEKAPQEDGESEGSAKGKAKKVVQKTKGFLKGLSDKAKAALGHASAAVQKFVADPKHRKRVLQDAAKGLKESPKHYAKRLVHTAKDEVHEFKEAGHAIKDVMKGKKLTPEQKKVVKKVATHMAIATAAAALTSTGVFAGAAVFGKGMVQKIALKAAMNALENVHTVNEVSHIGHGLQHLMHLAKDEKQEKLAPEEALAVLVMQCVARELENLDEETLAEILNETSQVREKKARNRDAASAQDLAPTLDRAESLMEDLSDWINRFDRVLVVARSESDSLENDRVWQDRFVRFFEEAEGPLMGLEHLDEILDSIYLGNSEDLADIANDARGIIGVPRPARIESAIQDIDFAINPNTGREGISYSVQRLRNWAKAFEQWVVKARDLKKLSQQAYRVV